MRTICDKCDAMIEIPNERSAGKTFKLRCRECGAMIVVKGPMDPSEPTPMRVLPKMKWFVVINGEAVGPLKTSEVFERYVNGEITNLTNIWRKGFDGYKELWRVSEFDALTGRGSSD